MKRLTKNAWFGPKKLIGWGWMPVKWQGWCVTILYILLVRSLVLFREKNIPGNPDSGSNFLTFALPIIVLTILFIVVIILTGDKPGSAKWIKKK